ncbi:aspartate carbamoyltransferase regulatory subunit [Halosquirtibacter xylanolyticus]|uniref:aspartate carbamoyltransferase regulatory subunit n=1 Tax=Halosquirtibacter xylanolyticus TaxID=3374599 RepID=UPI00374805D5|nr:aspartate carbamoyltransferase regulatory subunit [Prolixibacteraceae bacterium]
MQKILNVSAIKDGTVIDHISPDVLFKVISILKLDLCRDMVTIGNNLESKQVGKKGIIKIENRFFEDHEVDRIALIAPQAKLNIIKDYKVVDKRSVSIPTEIDAIAKCFNPKCITNFEDVTTHFAVVSKKPLALKCRYCEKITFGDQLELK